MPDRINFVTRNLDEDELAEVLEVIKEHSDIFHVFYYTQGMHSGKSEKKYFIAGQVWDDSKPSDLFCFLNGIAFAWCECDRLGGYGGYVGNEHSKMDSVLDK